MKVINMQLVYISALSFNYLMLNVSCEELHEPTHCG